MSLRLLKPLICLKLLINAISQKCTSDVHLNVIVHSLWAC